MPDSYIPTEEQYRRDFAMAHPELADELAKVPAGYYPIVSRVIHFDGVDEATMTKKKRSGALYISDIAPYPTEG
jgi:hypothetical protein